MISLERPIGTIAGIQVFRDHEDTNQFWYINDRPRVAVVNGEPEFVFVNYQEALTETFTDEQKQNLGGGIVAFTVDLSIEEDMLEEIRGELSRHAQGRPVLSPLVFESGSCRLSAMKNESDDAEAEQAGERLGTGLFEETWGSTQPSLVGNNRATFGVRLSHDMAAAFEASLTTGVGFIGVVYDLTFSAMAPSYEVRVEADYDRIYRSFEGELSVGGQIGPVLAQAQVEAALTKLVTDEVIRIEITDFGSDGAADLAMEWARGKITEDFFTATISPPALLTAQSASSSIIQQVSTAIGEFGQRTNRSTINSQTRSTASTAGDSAAANATNVVTNTRTTTSSSSGAGSDTGGGTDTESVDPGDEEQPEPESDADTNADDVTPSSEEQGEDTPATPARGENRTAGRGENNSINPIGVGLRLRFMRMEERRTRVYDMRRKAAVTRKAGPSGLIMDLGNGIDLSANIVTVDSANFDFIRRLDLELGPITDWSVLEVKATDTLVEYPGERAEGEDPVKAGTVGFSSTQGTHLHFQEFLTPERDLSYRYRTTVRFAPTSEWIGQDVVHVGPWQMGIGSGGLNIDALDVLNPHEITISADAQMFDHVRKSTVEFTYRDEVNDWSHGDTFVLNATQTEKVVKLRLTDPDIRTYSVKVTHDLIDGTVLEMSGPIADLAMDPDALDLSALNTSKLVIPPPYNRLRRVVVHPPYYSDLAEGMAILTYTDPAGVSEEQEQRVLFQADDKGNWKKQEVAFAVYGDGERPWEDGIDGQIEVQIVGRDSNSNTIRREPFLLTGSSVDL